MSLGQGLGAAAGAIIGTIILPGAGTLIGAGIGSSIGGLLFPVPLEPVKADLTEQELQFNTFSHDTPVPVLFGTFKWAPNVIFIGDAHSQVEVVGTQEVPSGGLSGGDDEQDIEKLVYYADFALGCCEGPIRRFDKVYREDEDITGLEGDFFTISLGSPGEAVPSIVTNAPVQIERPVPWQHTAKLLFSGRLGEANRVPRILIEATGHDLTVNASGTVASVASTVRAFYHDDLSDLLTLVTGDYTIVTAGREGEDKKTATIPNVTAYKTEVAAYDGRRATLMTISQRDANNLRRIIRGERNWDASSLWEITVGTAQAFQFPIDAWTVDDSAGVLWTIHYDATVGFTLVGTSFKDGTQRSVPVPTSSTLGLDVRALWYDKPYGRFYILYVVNSTMKLLRFNPDDPGDVGEMNVNYGYQDPIGVCRIGELICVFDGGSAQPIHLFEWSRSVDRYTFGSLNVALNFAPSYISGLKFHYDAGQITGLSNGNPVTQWNDQAPGHAIASQGQAAEQPTYRSSVTQFFNKPAVEFDGVDDDLDTFANTPSLNAANGVTLFFVIRPLGNPATQSARFWSMRNQPSPTPPTTQVIWTDIGWGAATVLQMSGPAVAVTGHVWLAFGATYASVPVAQNEAAIVAVRFKQGEVRIWKNGVLQTTFTNPLGFAASSVVNSVFMMGRWVGNTTPGQAESGHCNIQIAEAAVYERDLSLTEIEQANDYLRAKYRIAWGPSYGTYLGAGDKLVYGDPQAFQYSDGLSRILVLDRQTANTWAVYHHHWNGDGWSVLKELSYNHSMFDEVSSAAGAMWSFLSSERYGAGISTLFLRRYSFERASGFANQPVDNRYYTTDQIDYGPRYRLNYLLNSRKNLSAALQEMTTTCNGYFAYSEGRLEFHIDRDLGYIDGEYGEDNIIEGSFQFQELSREDRWNVVTVDCFDSKDKYRPIPVTATAEWEKDIYREARRHTISGVGITSLRQGGNIAWTSLLGFTTRRFACQFNTAAMGLTQTIGDVIKVSRPEITPPWIGKPMRIVRLEETETEDIRISCVEHIPLIAESNGFPLQEPQATLDTLIYEGGSNYSPVFEGCRSKTIENTVTGEIWLFVSKPDRAGPWATVRWHALWNSSPTSGAQFYPGTIPLISTAYTMVLSTSHFTPSGLLQDSLTNVQTSIVLTAVCGTPPEQGFDAIIFNEAITQQQFANPNGNGMYERAQGTTYTPGTKTMVVTRGIGTPANAHTVQQRPVGAIYTRQVQSAGESEGGDTDAQPIPIYVKNQVIPGQVNGSDPLTSPADEWYIGWDIADWGTAPSALNNIRVLVTSNYNLTNPNQDYKPIFEYSIGGGNWGTLRLARDETNGLRQSGTIAFDIPSDWVSMDKWKPSGPSTQEFFPTYNGSGTSAARFYMRIKRPVFSKPTPGTFNGLGGLTSPHPRDIKLIGQTTNAAKGYHSPTVYFLVANGTPKYDFISAEQGYGLKFRAQPVGMQSQSIPLENLTENLHTILNLAGE